MVLDFTVLMGHNYRNGALFSNNSKLNIGDYVYITDMTGKKIRYVIYNKYITATTDFDYAIRNTEGRREISMASCTDDSKSRLIIWCHEIMHNKRGYCNNCNYVNFLS